MWSEERPSTGGWGVQLALRKNTIEEGGKPKKLLLTLWCPTLHLHLPLQAESPTCTNINHRSRQETIITRPERRLEATAVAP